MMSRKHDSIESVQTDNKVNRPRANAGVDGALCTLDRVHSHLSNRQITSNMGSCFGGGKPQVWAKVRIELFQRASGNRALTWISAKLRRILEKLVTSIARAHRHQGSRIGC